jgi:monoamine oxidase
MLAPAVRTTRRRNCRGTDAHPAEHVIVRFPNQFWEHSAEEDGGEYTLVEAR